MPVKRYTVGPGTLIVGDTGSPQEISCQITSAVVAWSVESEDDVDLLCGDVAPGDEEFTAVINGTLYQDLSEAQSFVEFTWDNKGEVLPLRYVPSTAAGKEITGSVKMRPLDVGGEAKTKPTSDFEWPFVGEPVIGAVTP